MLILIATTAQAQSNDDPPALAGRVSEIAGTVLIAPDDPNTEWQPLSLNYPITNGDSIWAGQDGRAEIDFGSGHVRLGRETNIHFSEVDDRRFSAYLASGRAILRLRTVDPRETAKIDTANVQIDVTRPGVYRIETDRDGTDTVVVVRDGEVRLRTPDAAMTLISGQTATVSGMAPGSAIVVRDGYGTDGFDAWSADRDRRYEGQSVSMQYVSSEVPGVRDLDYYGTWDVVPTYGPVWYPAAVAADWVPYRDGSWSYVGPWGWTWVDRAPWGWVPFHYGRWVRVGSRWGWCPGEYVRRPVYAPALVAWYGGPSGTSWSVNFGGPTFGWVPLSWGEPYWPHHRHSSEYWRRANRPYAVDVRRVPSKPLLITYANARIPGAVTAVSGHVFTGRMPVAGNHRPVSIDSLSGAAVTTTPLHVRPLARANEPGSTVRAPAPASAFVGRTPVERSALSAPGAARMVPPRTPVVTEPARPGVVEPARQTVVESPRPGMGLSRSLAREPAVNTAPQVPGRVYAPQQPVQQSPAPMQAPGHVYNPAPAPMQAPGNVYNPGQSTMRPNLREQSLQRQPSAPTAQPVMPAPPAPAPIPAAPTMRGPVIREPAAVAPMPVPPASGPPPQIQRPASSPQGVVREPGVPVPAPGQAPR